VRLRDYHFVGNFTLFCKILQSNWSNNSCRGYLIQIHIMFRFSCLALAQSEHPRLLFIRRLTERAEKPGWHWRPLLNTCKFVVTSAVVAKLWNKHVINCWPLFLYFVFVFFFFSFFFSKGVVCNFKPCTERDVKDNGNNGNYRVYISRKAGMWK
jgi:hypothetical protein